MKEKLLISFSGGRTSAMMTKYLLENFQDKYEMIVVFANTGKERKETLDFVDKCDKKFNFNVIWIEALVNFEHKKGTEFKIVDYKTASRAGEPFENVIKKYGMPCFKSPHCTRELKIVPINKFAKSLGWKNYTTAIGIRTDEPKRLDFEKKKKRRLLYFAELFNVTKSDVNNFWSKQSFDLDLKSYEGNCDLCFKKGFRKLMTILVEKPELANWWRDMENKYSNIELSAEKINAKPPYFFYRDHQKIDDIIEESKFPFDLAIDESNDIDKFKQMQLWDSYLDSNGGCTESCEVY